MAQLTDNERYIYNYLNSKSSILSFYVPRVLDSKVSKDEKQNYIDRIVALIKEIYAIMENLQIDSVPINGFFNELYLLKESGIYEVDDLLNKYNYVRVIENGYINVLRKVSLRGKLRDEEIVCVEFLIKNHLIDDDIVFEHFLRSALLKEIEISYDSFETLFVDYAKMRMKEYVPCPKCVITSEKNLDFKEGYSYKDTMYLSYEDLQKLYYSGVFKSLKNLFHELGHVKQYKDIMLDKKSNPFILKQIKEEILSCYMPGYYEDNCEKISFELEAEFFGITEMLKLFINLGINFKNEKNPYTGVLAELIGGVNNNIRFVSGEEQTIDEVFDFLIIHHPELLATYPQLNTEYEIGYDDLVIRKDDFGRRDNNDFS